MKSLTLSAIGLALTAIANSFLGYYWFHGQGQRVAEGICYLIAIVAAGLAIRCWDRRNFYP